MYESTRTFQYAKPRADTLVDLQQALAKIGRVDEVSDLTGTVVGRCRVGFRNWTSVKLRAAVLDGPEGQSVVQINGYGTDIWGIAARKGLDKLTAALDALRRP